MPLELPSYVEIYSSLDQFVATLKDHRALRPTGPRSAQSMIDILSSETPKGTYCKSIVVEKEYVDQDYVDAFGRYYSRSFQNYPRRSMRFHFFSEKVTKDILLPSSNPEENSQRHKFLRDFYLGYSVLQPSRPDTIGRTWIPLPPFIHERYTVSILRDTRVNLLGWPLQAIAAPFVEQDTRVAACATAATWMAHASLYRKLSLAPKSMTEITELAGRVSSPVGRPIPSSGLTVEQINWALNAMGYGPRLVESTGPNTAITRSSILSYVESEIPVIAMIVNEKKEGHTVTIIGYVHSPRQELELGLVISSEQENRKIPFSSYVAEQWVDTFLAHDDQRGLYCLLSIQPPPLHQRNGLKTDKDSLHRITIRSGFGNNLRKVLFQGYLWSMIAPLPPLVFLTADEALLKSVYCLIILEEEARKKGYDLLKSNEMVLRTRLLASNKFKDASDFGSGVEANDKLVFNGGVLGIGSNPSFSSGLKRKPLSGENKTPMEMFIFEPRYIPFFEKDLGKVRTHWQEIGGELE